MELLGVLWINVVPAWLVARSLAHELRAACLFSRLGREHVRIDLWDLRPLAPFAHRGLHGVLLWSGGMAIAGLMYLVSSWAGPAWQTALALALVAVAMLLLPAYGVHRNIAETKQRQLDRLHEALRAGEAELLQHESPVPAEAAARVQGLMVLRDAVRSVREWPFDAPALLRFALYLAIGFGSWLGGALVERMLGVVLQ